MKKLAITSGTTFVLAWIAGLLVAGGGPKPTDPAAEIAAYFAAHERTAMLQHFLIDAVAGGALIGIAFLARRHSRVAFTAGVAATSVSLVQFAIGERKQHRCSPTSLQRQLYRIRGQVRRASGAQWPAYLPKRTTDRPLSGHRPMAGPGATQIYNTAALMH